MKANLQTKNKSFCKQKCNRAYIPSPLGGLTIGSRIREARLAKKMNQTELAKAVGVKSQAVSQWESDVTKPEGRNLQRTAEELGVRQIWLDKGFGRRQDNPDIMGRRIAIISTVEAGQFSPAADPYPVGFEDGEIPIELLPLPVGPNAFGLRIRGDSMLDEYHSGDIVIIDPEATPRAREPVVAKRDEDEDATFKLYIPRGNDENGHPIIELAPLNSHFKTLLINHAHPGRIIGPMVSRIQGRRTH